MLLFSSRAVLRLLLRNELVFRIKVEAELEPI
jgi:hypothetical protein